MANTPAAKRLRTELRDMSKGTDNHLFTFELVDNNLFRYEMVLKGQPGTPYNKGKFKISLVANEQYPFKVPKVKFITPIWHPNISSDTGLICLDVLKDRWSPTLSIRTIMLSLAALLSTPEPDDPQDAAVAKQYKKDKRMCQRTAKYWTIIHSRTDCEKRKAFIERKFSDFEEKIAQLKKHTRRSHKNCMALLSENFWDVERVVKLINKAKK